MGKSNECKVENLTEFGEEEKEHDEGGYEGDETTRKSTAVEIFIDFRVSIQIPNLIEYTFHPETFRSANLFFKK